MQCWWIGLIGPADIARGKGLPEMHRSLHGLAWFGVGVCCVLLSPCCAFAGPCELQGAFSSTQWATIGDVGNRRPTDAEAGAFRLPGDPVNPGRVDYAYRIATTEVTVAQHLEFLNAYAPFLDPSVFRWGSGLTGFFILHTNPGSGSVPTFEALDPAMTQWPTEMGWESAARMVNWLHNGQVGEASAFEGGVYDASTFGRDENNRPTHNFSPAPGARFSIPTHDELYKAMYYDPNKPNDDGTLGAYWQYPDSSDTPLIAGLPEDGGQTLVGLDRRHPLPVGSYSDVVTPWGLLDASGGVAEWTTTPVNNSLFVRDSSFRGGVNSEFDDWFHLWLFGSSPLNSAPYGVRLVSSIPTPGAVAVFCFLCIAGHRRRR